MRIAVIALVAFAITHPTAVLADRAKDPSNKRVAEMIARPTPAGPGPALDTIEPLRAGRRAVMLVEIQRGNCAQMPSLGRSPRAIRAHATGQARGVVPLCIIAIVAWSAQQGRRHQGGELCGPARVGSQRLESGHGCGHTVGAGASTDQGAGAIAAADQSALDSRACRIAAPTVRRRAVLMRSSARRAAHVSDFAAMLQPGRIYTWRRPAGTRNFAGDRGL